MTITVCYYGLLAERRGLSSEKLSVSTSTPALLYQELNRAHALGLSIADFRVAVNDEFVAWDSLLKDNDSVALLPPMSGG